MNNQNSSSSSLPSSYPKPPPSPPPPPPLPNQQNFNLADSINNFEINPIIIIILVIVVAIYLILFLSLGNSNNSNNSSSEMNENNKKTSSFFIVIIVGLFILLILLNGAQYFLGIDIIASINNLFSPEPQIDIIVNENNYQPSVVPEITIKKQVFNIPGNNYSYPDAKALCSAYGSSLANYEQIENVYNKGGEWCNYGWSEGQMALFPTQTDTFNQLQEIPDHENDCGRPGVNGGFMANPALKFGVNCFGYKPQITSQEAELMEDVPKYPKTAKDLAMEQRVEYWKTKLTEILVSPFNYNSWSKI